MTDCKAQQQKIAEFAVLKKQLERESRRGIAMPLFLPMILLPAMRQMSTGLSMPFMIALVMIVMLMAGLQLRQFLLLRQIDPVNMTADEAGAAALTLRRTFIRNAGIGVALAVPLLAVLGYMMFSMDTHYLMYGFIVGLIIGVPCGVLIFRRRLREINALCNVL